jgi:hypothetical protein
MTARLFRAYFRTGSAPPVDSIRECLWSSNMEPVGNERSYHYSQVVLEQYRLYAEMAERIGARRGLANIIFLTLNSTMFTVNNVLWINQPAVVSWLQT